MFIHLFAYLRTDQGMSRESHILLEALEMDSPLSTKQLKEAAALQGRYMESTYNRAMKTLWQRMLIVGYGEIEDSSFPSLAVGATKNIFEDLWNQSSEITFKEAESFIQKKLPADNKFRKFAEKIRAASVDSEDKDAPRSTLTE